MHFLPITSALLATFINLAPAVSGLAVARDTALPKVPSPFNIVVTDTKNPSWKKKLFVPANSNERPVVFPRVDDKQYSKFTLNENKTITVADSNADASAPGPMLLYMAGDPTAALFSLVARPFADPAWQNYTLLTNSVANSKYDGGKTQISLTIGAAVFRSFDNVGQLGFSAVKNSVRTGGGDGPDDSTIERFQFVAVADGGKIDDVLSS